MHVFYNALSMNHWLLKSEPGVFSIDDLAKQGEAIWDGVRNYQARIYLRAMQAGDVCFFYHSNCAEIGIAGVCTVTVTLVADPTQFDPKSDYYDPKSTPEAPRWETVKVAFAEKFKRVLTLDELKANFTPDELMVVRKGMRFSVMPVDVPVAERVLQMGRA
jgi:predicted RNA-binding protein with PUA-like domain